MVRECICMLSTNRTMEAEGDFCGLPMRRDEGRVVDPPLVFKNGFLGDKRRALMKGGPRLEWNGRKDDKRRWRWRTGVK
ncbi:hypothetical protein TNCV_1668141 [Trichonephila clavipes]|nr:hypothetical protein TNCV_1668141 [Trichonephila clavipes]